MTRTERYGLIVDRYISDMEYPVEPIALYDPIRYTMDEGGKRLRPMFALMSCGLWRDDISEALPAAAAIEMFHNFTLLHDDIMDNAPLRRGRPSVYNRWGGDVAILSGDSLMIHAYCELAKIRTGLLDGVLDYFNEAAVKVCEGQQYDMDFEARDDVGFDEHVAMIELKTSALFVGAVSMGAAVAGASQEDISRLRDFALEFGVAFQMQDDLLDSYGDARLGKSVGGDILEGKKTFLKMYAMPSASPDECIVLNSVHLDASLTAAEKIERVISIYDRCGVKQAAEAEIAARFGTVAAALDGLSAEPERIGEFKTFALSLLGRTK